MLYCYTMLYYNVILYHPPLHSTPPRDSTPHRHVTLGSSPTDSPQWKEKGWAWNREADTLCGKAAPSLPLCLPLYILAGTLTHACVSARVTMVARWAHVCEDAVRATGSCRGALRSCELGPRQLPERPGAAMTGCLASSPSLCFLLKRI